MRFDRPLPPILAALALLLGLSVVSSSPAQPTVYLGEVRSFEDTMHINLSRAYPHLGVDAYGDTDRTVRGVLFQEERSGPIAPSGLLPGVGISAQNQINNWSTEPTLTGPDATNMNDIMHDIRWSQNPNDLFVDLSGLTVGRAYRVQMLTHENMGANRLRAWDIYWDTGTGGANTLAVDEFDSGGRTNPSKLSGTIWEYTFQAEKPDYQIGFVSHGGSGDRNPILNAIVVSAVTEPLESDWENNKTSREDPRPIEVYPNSGRPTIDGTIDPLEWAGATTYQSYNPEDPNQLWGELYARLSDGYLTLANDWIINTEQDSAIGGRNAWRFGTSNAAGPTNSGNDDWYEVLVEDDPLGDRVWARVAGTEAELQNAPWQLGSDFGIDAAANFDPAVGNWQYELLMGQEPLPFCWHWEWQQIDPRPGDGVWIPVFDGSLHHAPEPSTLLIWSLLAGLGIGVAWKRRRA